MSIAPDKVLEAFADLTGIRFRILPDTVLRQAVVFGGTFTLDELELVIRFIDRERRAGRCGYNAQSVQWRTLMGDYGASNAFQSFQERLGLAQAAQRGGWRPKLKYGQTAAPPPVPLPPKPAPPDVVPESEDTMKATAAALRTWMEQQRGGSA